MSNFKLPEKIEKGARFVNCKLCTARFYQRKASQQYCCSEHRILAFHLEGSFIKFKCPNPECGQVHTVFDNLVKAE